jgi:amidase
MRTLFFSDRRDSSHSSLAPPSSAFNYVADANGTYWGVQTPLPRASTPAAFAPRRPARCQNGAFTTTLNGFGGIMVFVQSGRRRASTVN